MGYNSLGYHLSNIWKILDWSLILQSKKKKDNSLVIEFIFLLHDAFSGHFDANMKIVYLLFLEVVSTLLVSYKKPYWAQLTKVCPLGGSTRAGAIQMQMLTANQQIEHRDPNGEIRGRTEGVEGTLSNINWRGGPWSCEGMMPQAARQQCVGG